MIVGVLLAAGRSTRFGRDKLLQPGVDGVPLGLQAARCLSPLEHSLVVIPSGNRALTELFQGTALQVVPLDPPSPPLLPGMSHSLQAGLLAAPAALGWVVALGDMPRVQPETVAAIRHELEAGAGMVACRYRGQRGNPVGFSQRFGEALLGLRGESGARGLLVTYAEEVCWLEPDDPGILFDVDVPADWPGP